VSAELKCPIPQGYRPYECASGITGWQCRLRDSFNSYEEFEGCALHYGLATRLGFDTAEEAWDANPHIHGSVRPEDWGVHVFPTTYLHVRDSLTGEQWIREIRPREILDLRKLVKKWVRETFGGELRLDGKIMPRLEGDFYAKIKLDAEPPDSVRNWESGGFYLTS
jgi:hypothetical protein